MPPGELIEKIIAKGDFFLSSLRFFFTLCGEIIKGFVKFESSELVSIIKPFNSITAIMLDESSSPYNLVKFSNENNYDLLNLDLTSFLKKIISNNDYKKDSSIRYLIYDFLEFYFYKINSSFSSKVYDNYIYFLKRISETKKFNLDEESLFMEFEEEILNG